MCAMRSLDVEIYYQSIFHTHNLNCCTSIVSEIYVFLACFDGTEMLFCFFVIQDSLQPGQPLIVYCAFSSPTGQMKKIVPLLIQLPYL